MIVKQLPNGKAIVRINEVSRIVDITGIDSADEQAIRQRFAAALVRPSLASNIAPHIKKRREKMIAIGEQSVAGRNRIFKHLPHVPASRKNQAYDGLIALFLRGKITFADKIMVRNLKTGEYDNLTVGEMLDEVGEMYLLQLKLRERDQEYRDQVNAIFKDDQKSDEDKARTIESIELPEFLDVDEESTSRTLVSRSANGKTNKA